MSDKKKTWFLSPDFSFFPEGDIRLGTILTQPDRPTLVLASLGPEETPTIKLPDVNIITEPGHTHSTGSSRSASANVFAKFIELASISGSTDISRYQDRSFSEVDHQVRLFSRAPTPETLRAILQLESVKEYVNGGRFGRFKKRPVYMISGLRVAKDSFSVTEGQGSSTSVAGEASVSAAALGAPLPLEIGAGASTTGEKYESHSYKTVPGVIFAYRMHIIHPKPDGDAEIELFSDTTAFFTGEGDEEEDEKEMELTELTGDIAVEEKGAKVTIEKFSIGDEEVVVFRRK